MPKLSQTAVSILTLLNNIDELIVQSNNRQDARDVMSALRIYAKEKSFRLPDEKIENFLAVLLDKKAYVLSELVKDIAVDVATVDNARPINKTFQESV